MKIVVNGENRDVAPGATIASLLETLGFSAETTVVERNAGIVERAAYGDTALTDGDRLELVRFVGGG